MPLQPSSWPARLPSAGHVGVQTQVPSTQRPLGPHPLGPQSHVSTQLPLVHVLPGGHLTPAQRLVTQAPPAQTWPVGQETPAHGSAGTQASAQAWPAPQRAAQGTKAAHFPVWASHDCPVGQVTPLQGAEKQPATQAPAMHVSFAAQVTPWHGSATAMQAAVQVVPVAQVVPASAPQGSG